MTLRQKIRSNESKLKTYIEFLDTITLIQENKDDKAAIEFLVKCQILDFESRIKNVKENLEKDKKVYIVEFEKQSAECNFLIQDVVREVCKWIGREPLGVTENIKPLTDKFKKDAFWSELSQEERNDVYFELKGHLNFLKNVYKPNA